MLKFILFFSLSMSAVCSADVIEGQEFIDNWQGTFKNVQCLQCPDHVVKSGANMKNFLFYHFDYQRARPDQMPSCADTDIGVKMAFAVDSDDGKITSSVLHFPGLCDWGPGKVLLMTADSFEYRLLTPLEEKRVTLKKRSDGLFDYYRLEYNENPSFGYPEFFEYRAIVEKSAVEQ